MDGACMTSTEDVPSPTGKGPVRKALVIPLTGSMPHALLYDLTHDNESPADKRSPEDALSTGALVTFAHCAIGSVKGFDDLYPKLLNLVGENRKYEVTGLGPHSGAARVKRVLNSLHMEMMLGGYVEGHVHQENDVSVLCKCRVVDANLRTVYCTASRAPGYPEGVLAGGAYGLQQGQQGQRTK